MESGFSGFDIIALAVIFISGVMALTRGFVREALTVTAFIAAALAALWTRPVFAGLILELTSSYLLANIIAMASTFILVYLAVSFVTSSLSRDVKQGEDVNVVDRTLGFVFGVIRGLILLGLVVLVFKNTTLAGPPGWLRTARIYPLVEATSNLLQSLAPSGSWAAQSHAETEAQTPAQPQPTHDQGTENTDTPLDPDPIGSLIQSRSQDDDG